MILDDKICRLADLYGIELHATIENKVYLLQAMGVKLASLAMGMNLMQPA